MGKVGLILGRFAPHWLLSQVMEVSSGLNALILRYIIIFTHYLQIIVFKCSFTLILSYCRFWVEFNNTKLRLCVLPIRKFHVISDAEHIWNCNIFTYEAFISHIKCEHFYIRITSFICEISIYIKLLIF